MGSSPLTNKSPNLHKLYSLIFSTERDKMKVDFKLLSKILDRYYQKRIGNSL